MVFGRSILVGAMLLGAATAGATPDSVPGVDSPALAHPGTMAVGVRTLTFVDRENPDVSADGTKATPAGHERTLTVDLWYPAKAKGRGPAATYTATMAAEPPLPPTRFTVQGIAYRDVPALPGPHPLVIFSHGHGNATAAHTWITENLASKGYVVAAIRHEDGATVADYNLPRWLLRRPLDIGFVAAQLKATFAKEGLIDPTRIALVGYSAGGYGVIAAGGATFDPASPFVARVPDGLLAAYAPGGAKAGQLLVPGLRAIVAIAPAVAAPGRPFGNDGAASIRAPLLLISGDIDPTVNYETGAKAFFHNAVGTNRYLLTYRRAGHNIGIGSAPEAMTKALYDADWFDDPVWRKERLIAINLHMITAFLDRYVRDDAAKTVYIDGLVPRSEDGVWPAAKTAPWAAISDGKDGVTIWPGFQRRHHNGLELEHLEAGQQ